MEMETDKMYLSERVNYLRNKMLTLPSVCTERACLITESYKETEGEPSPIRQAKALSKILSRMGVRIDGGELIVGNATSKQRGGAILPEINAQFLLEEMNQISTREWDRFIPLAENEKAKIKEILPYWVGKSVFDRWRVRMPEDKQKFLFNGAMGGTLFSANGHYAGHSAVDYEKVLTKGLYAVKQEVDDALRELNLADPEDFQKYQFLKASGIVLEAVPKFAKRYSELAKSLAEKEADARRKAELDKIAETCSRIPGERARTFFEALQSMCFIWIALMLEGWGYGMSFGRTDQYLYPFYKKDMAEGRLTDDEARALISLLYIKVNGTVTVTDSMAATVFGGFPQTVNVILGGLTKEGKDAVNELSYLFLEADKDVGMSQNDLVIRIHKNTPDAFVMKACEVAKTLTGKLKFMSDETNIQQLLHDGHPIEYARDYIITGCNSPSVPGRSFDVPGGMFNLPLMLDLALNNGASRLSGEQIGPQTGDPRKFRFYEEVFNAYKKQVEALLPLAILFRNSDRQLYAEYVPTPFQSSLFSGPISKGLDMANGGTLPYARLAISLSGAPNVADSLAAVKKAVFEEKNMTMDQLITALERNFEGEEEVSHLLSSAPKFGNDDDYVDSIVNEVLMHGRNEATRYKGACGTKFNVAAAAVTANVPLGFAVGALPDGKRAGKPLSEGGISPYQGRNTSGPTATLRSVAKLDHVKLTNGSVLNMRFNPGVLKDEASTRKFASMIRTYLETGGFFVQFNIVGTETLRAAQKEPEKYRDLLVRVATYSAYFVELSPELQEDVIRRTEFTEV